MPERPLCFVVMPFGKKRDPGGGPEIDFDGIYRDAIAPAISGAGLEPLREDEERAGGIIHKTMFEKLLLCEFAVADLTTANANVFYELGVRHAVRPSTTLSVFASRTVLPFDVRMLRALPYELGSNNELTTEGAEALQAGLSERLRRLRQDAAEEPAVDSPLYQLLEGFRAPDLARLKTDTFRDRVRYSQELKRKLREARELGKERGGAQALLAIERAESLDALEAGVLVDLFISYRAVSAWQEMLDLYPRLPAPLRRSVLVREQYAFALNRAGEPAEATRVLEEVLAEQGPSSETCGILGRVYKDRWQEAVKSGEARRAHGYLDKAIETYEMGFQADWRDAYPGINTATLLDIRGDPASLSRRDELVPVVRFAVTQRLRARAPDYWDHATLLELAVLGEDEALAAKALSDALATPIEGWMPTTTAGNLTMIRNARSERGLAQPWLDDLIAELERASAGS